MKLKKEGIVGNIILAGLLCVLLAVMALEKGSFLMEGVEVEPNTLHVARQMAQDVVH
ncbi:hypothetical protein [Sneathiella limimaris]|uniref:hypothetical protein n=1 Tax=Sneathiella limimaris TaxID=1964213 RepID=UPI00146EF654|nr:hypothetical protein [Sneathiella limimaris]